MRPAATLRPRSTALITSPDRQSLRGRAGWRFVFRHPAHTVAIGFGSGLFPFAPGTAGTLFALLAFAPLAALTGDWLVTILVAVSVVGIWACEVTGKALGAADHGAIVWDEIVAFWWVLLLTPNTPVWQAAAFVLFRLFDIWKPSPIGEFDRRYKNGFGVMLDDILAGFYTLLVLALARRFMV